MWGAAGDNISINDGEDAKKCSENKNDRLYTEIACSDVNGFDLSSKIMSKLDASKWGDKPYLDNPTDGTLSQGIYRIEVAGGAGGKGGDASVTGGHYKGDQCGENYLGGAGGKGEVIKRIIVVKVSDSFKTTIGEKGAGGENKSCKNCELTGGKGEDGKETTFDMNNGDKIKARSGKGGTGAVNDDYWCGYGRNSACSCWNGSEGGGYKDGNDGVGYVKIYQYQI